MVRAGTAISGSLRVAVNSESPGVILGQISRDVYDEDMRVVLIPRGSRVLGEYSSSVALGKNRLVVAWKEIQVLRPGGGSMSVPVDARISDRAGASGVPGKVDNHYGRVFGSAVMLSVLGAGFQLSQPQQGVFGVPSPTQTAAGAVGQQLNQVTAEILERNLDIEPTIEIPQGTPFTILLAKDLVLLPAPVPRRAET